MTKSTRSTSPPNSGMTVRERDELWSRIRARIAQGENDHEVARAVGCSDQTVYRYRKRHGIPQQAYVL